MAMTEDEAQRIHDEARAADPEHDRSSCWCCCWDCDFDFARIVAAADDLRTDD